MKHLQFGIQREPNIKELGPFRFLGLQVEMSSFLQDKEYVEKAPAHWRMFTMRLDELQQRKSENRYGVALSEGGQMLESRLQYLAALDCLETSPVPPGMSEALFAKRLYAIFENIGLADRSQDTIDYISRSGRYGISARSRFSHKLSNRPFRYSVHLLALIKLLNGLFKEKK